MKRCLVLGMAWGLLAMAWTRAEVVIHVAADSSAGGDGSLAKPYQTLAQARDGIRARRQAGSLPPGETVAVELAPGIYPLTASFALGETDGGTAEAPVIYRASEPGQAKIRGGLTLDPSWFTPLTDEAARSRLEAPARDKVRVCDLSSRIAQPFGAWRTAFQGPPAPPSLYAGGRPLTLARWPNAGAAEGGWAGFTKTLDTGLPQPEAADPALRALHPGTFLFDDPRPARWNLDEGVWLLGYWTHDWSDEVIRIASYDKEKKAIQMAAPHSYGINGGTWGAKQRRFYAMNALEELDAPGEWFLDRSRKLLYFYPEKDSPPGETVLATLTEPLVRANGTKHLHLVGLDFQYGHSDGIIARQTEGFEVIGSVVANLAGSGISLNGTANAVRSCDVYHLGRGGISLSGGDRKSLAPAGNVAVNNHVHHYGLYQRTYAAGIGVQGCGQIVRHNRIHDAPHNAVLYGGNEHLFERNEIYRVVLETGDAGAFYTGRDWTSQGNVLRHNFIHDLGGGDAGHVNTMGVYLDDCDCGDTLEGNVFLRAGRAIMIGGGRDNPVRNNLVIDCPIGLHIDSRGMTWKQWNNPADKSWCLEEKAKQVNYTEPPWSVRYPRLAAIFSESPREPLGNPVLRNVFVDCAKQVCSFDGNVKKLLDRFEIAENLVVNSNGTAQGTGIEGFANLAGTADRPICLDRGALTSASFASSWVAWIQKQVPSFAPIPLPEIGLYVDEFRRSLPSP